MSFLSSSDETNLVSFLVANDYLQVLFSEFNESALNLLGKISLSFPDALTQVW
jgi:hypothetical protein